MGHHYDRPIVSFVAVILVLLPLPWHWKARNVATLSLIAWLAVCNFSRGVNAILWMDNVDIRYRVWCDITTKIMVGASTALPACSFCITRHLEHVASTRYAVTTAADKKRRRYIDLCFTIGIPSLIMALHYIVQGHRFDILEDFGCQPVVYTSWAGLLIVYGTPILLSLGSLVYASLALRHFAIRRLEFEQHLKDSRSALTTGRYMRLMALALSEMLWGTSLGSYVMFANVRKLGLRPWISWADVHYNFSRIAVFPTFLIPRMWEVLLVWWVLPSTSILFFLFFGLSDEAREGYVSIYRWIRRVVFRRSDDASHGTADYSKSTTLPQFRSGAAATRKRDIDEMSFDLPDLKTFGDTAPPTYLATDFHKAIDEPETPLSLTLPHVDCESGPAPTRREEDDFSILAMQDTPPRSPDSPTFGSPDPNGIHVSTHREVA